MSATSIIDLYKAARFKREKLVSEFWKALQTITLSNSAMAQTEKDFYESLKNVPRDELIESLITARRDALVSNYSV